MAISYCDHKIAFFSSYSFKGIDAKHSCVSILQKYSGRQNLISLIDIFFRYLESLSGSGGQFDEILRYLGCFVCLDLLLLPNWFELV